MLCGNSPSVNPDAKSVTIPYGVVYDGDEYLINSIPVNVFQGNQNIEQLVIGANVNSIPVFSFWGCTSLHDIQVDSYNKDFYVSDGALCRVSTSSYYDSDGVRQISKYYYLIYYFGENNTIEIPETINTIQNYSFLNRTGNDRENVVLSYFRIS